MGRYIGYHANYAVGTNNAHVGFNAIQPSLIQGDVVVLFIDRVVDDASRNKLVGGIPDDRGISLAENIDHL